jgi:uncharacterized protein
MPEIKTLALFPLNSVLFPGGLLQLKVFEARYLELITRCLDSAQPVGIILKQPGSPMESLGTRAELLGLEATSTSTSILHVRCRGTQRFTIQSLAQASDGLWQAQVQGTEDDPLMLPSLALIPTAEALASAMAKLKQQGRQPFLKPFQFDSAGWVANRWCEILPISNAAKHQLLALPDPMVRLQLVGDYLRGQGVIG